MFARLCRAYRKDLAYLGSERVANPDLKISTGTVQRANANPNSAISGGRLKSTDLTYGDDPNQYVVNARNADLANRNRSLFENRVPVILTCQSWIRQGRQIELWVNPREVNWSFKLRGTTTAVKGGTTSYVWRDSSRGSTYFDEPRIGFTFQTGNCAPVYIDDSNFVRVPPGLLDLYEFFELMNEPMVLDDGTMNYRVIAYNSVLFPQIVLYGFFQPDQEFTFSESAEDSTQTSWSHTFILRTSIPKFYNAAALAYTFQYRSANNGAGPANVDRALNDINQVFQNGEGVLGGQFDTPLAAGRQGSGLTAQDRAEANKENLRQDFLERLASGEIRSNADAYNAGFESRSIEDEIRKKLAPGGTQPLPKTEQQIIEEEVRKKVSPITKAQSNQATAESIFSGATNTNTNANLPVVKGTGNIFADTPNTNTNIPKTP